MPDWSGTSGQLYCNDNDPAQTFDLNVAEAASGAATVMGEVEPNDDCTTANTLTLGDPMMASINPETDHDWFAFTAEAGHCVRPVAGNHRRNNGGTHRHDHVGAGGRQTDVQDFPPRPEQDLALRPRERDQAQPHPEEETS